MQKERNEKSIEPVAGCVKKLLVCLDGSKYAEAGLDYALSVSKALHAEIQLFRIHESVAHCKNPMPVDTLGTEISKASARQYLENTVAKLREQGITATTRTAQGEVAEQILRAAQGEDAVLLVMSSHGETSEMKWRMGSTTQKVVSRLSSSVLVVRPDTVEEQPKALRRIMLPLDASVRAECALPMALGLAKANKAELMLVHLVPEPHMSIPLPTSREDRELSRKLLDRNLFLADTYLRGIQQKQSSHQDVSITRHIAPTSDVGQEIIDLADREQVDLIIMSAHGRTGNLALPHGSLPHHLLSYCARPILVLQDLRHRGDSGASHTNEESPHRLPHVRLT